MATNQFLQFDSVAWRKPFYQLIEYSFLLGSSLFDTKVLLHPWANITLILGIVNLIANYPPQ